MKKWITIIATAALAFGLSACNQTATPKEGSNVENKSEMTFEEVYTKSIEQSEVVNSMKAQIDMQQKIEIPSQNVSMDMNSKMDMTMTVKPFGIYQKGITSMTGAEGENMEMESYMTEQGFFVFDSLSNQWMKLPSEMYEQIMAMSDQQVDPGQQLKDLAAFKDDFKFEHTDTAYILRLSSSGDKFNELIRKQMSESMPDLMAGEQEVLNNMDIQKVEYEIYIDKETFNTTKLNMVMEMTFKVEGEEMQMAQDLKSVFSDYNKVDEIVVPQEVIDNAIEM